MTDIETQPSAGNDTRLPVTVLSGFLGAGKTSVLKNILEGNHGERVAVIVNDMAELNLDAKAVVKVAPKLVSMQNGCICCTLRGDLLEHVASLAKEGKWDYLVIESTGISEPLPVAQTFVLDLEGFEEQHEGHDHDHDHPTIDGEEETPPLLLEYARLDTMVTVVDAYSFLERLSEISLVRDQPDAEGNEDEDRTLADLMVDQVEFANVILLNKIDLLEKKANGGKAELDAVKALIHKLNPKAKVIPCKHGNVPLKEIMNTHTFDMEEAQASAGWLAELAKPMHTPETEEYGVSSIVFRAHKPFHPQRLHAILSGFARLDGIRNKASDTRDSGESMHEGDEAGIFNGVIRSKGRIWLANAHAVAFDWHSAGHVFNMTSFPTPYYARYLENHLQVDVLADAFKDAKSDAELNERMDKALDEVFEGDALEDIGRLKEEGHWSNGFGDRSQELVFIGVHLNKDEMRAALEGALLTDEEMAKGVATWRDLEDPFFGGECAANYWDIADDEDEGDDEEEDEEEDEERKEGDLDVGEDEDQD